MTRTRGLSFASLPSMKIKPQPFILFVFRMFIFLTVVHQSMAARETSLYQIRENLINQRTRPTINSLIQSLGVNYVREGENPFRSHTLEKTGSLSTLEELEADFLFGNGLDVQPVNERLTDWFKVLPDILAQLVQVYGDKKIVIFGRDPLAFGDMIDAVFLKLGMPNHVIRLPYSKETIFGSDSKDLIEFTLDTLNLEKNKLRDSRGFIFLDSTRFLEMTESGKPSQMRYFMQLMFNHFHESEHMDLEAFLEKMNGFSTKLGKTEAIDLFTTDAGVVAKQIKTLGSDGFTNFVPRLMVGKMLDFLNFMYQPQWDRSFGVLKRVDGRLQPSLSLGPKDKKRSKSEIKQHREAILSDMFEYLHVITPHYLRWIELHLRARGTSFAMIKPSLREEFENWGEPLPDLSDSRLKLMSEDELIGIFRKYHQSGIFVKNLLRRRETVQSLSESFTGKLEKAFADFGEKERRRILSWIDEVHRLKQLQGNFIEVGSDHQQPHWVPLTDVGPDFDVTSDQRRNLVSYYREMLKQYDDVVPHFVSRRNPVVRKCILQAITEGLTPEQSFYKWYEFFGAKYSTKSGPLAPPIFDTYNRLVVKAQIADDRDHGSIELNPLTLDEASDPRLLDEALGAAEIQLSKALEELPENHEVIKILGALPDAGERALDRVLLAKFETMDLPQLLSTYHRLEDLLSGKKRLAEIVFQRAFHIMAKDFETKKNLLLIRSEITKMLETFRLGFDRLMLTVRWPAILSENVDARLELYEAVSDLNVRRLLMAKNREPIEGGLITGVRRLIAPPSGYNREKFEILRRLRSGK